MVVEDVHLRAHLAQVPVVHQAHHLVARQALVRVVRQVRAVLVQALRQVLEVQATHHQARALVVQEVLVAHEALVVLHQ